MNIPCDGDGCSLCALMGPPKAIKVAVREEGSKATKWLAVSTETANALGIELNHSLKGKVQ